MSRLRTVLIAILLLCAATAYQQAAPFIHSDDAVDSPEPARPPAPREVNVTFVREIHCFDPEDEEVSMLGTASVIEEDVLITAAHVVGSEKNLCYDAATMTAMKVSSIDWQNDFAILTMETGPQPEYLAYSCEGFRTDQRYTAFGWTKGDLPEEYGVDLRMTFLEAGPWVTDQFTFSGNMRTMGLRYFSGPLYPGMSGGPIFDERGVIIGINSARNSKYSFGRSLKDTSLCGEPRRNPPTLLTFLPF